MAITPFFIVLLILSVAVNVWLVWNVMRPLQRLVANTSKLAGGDLTALNQSCGGIREIGELRHTMASMAQHVRRAQDEGLNFRHAITDGQEAERARIAHELHDDTVQSLVAIAQSIELASNWLERDQTRAKSMLHIARTQALESVGSLRRMIANLRPPALEELGITAALRMLDAEANPAADSKLDVKVNGTERRIADSHELALFRVAQEAVQNARKHGKAKHITLTLDFHPSHVDLAVADDGAGFAVPSSFDTLAKREHFGLIGMHERVQQLNGTLNIASQTGKGTTVQVCLPLESSEQPTETVRDPVCGAMINPQQAFGSTLYDGTRFYFCCPVCQGAFQKNPKVYLPGIITPA